MRTKLLTGAALFVLALPASAFAQQAGQEGDPAANDGALAEIVVTAQRREEGLQDVPLAVTAADANTLAQARVENISNISAISPSIQFRASNISSSSANVIIRGLGTTGNSRSFEGAVGIFIDGVYRTRAASALENFLDIGLVQVLRGPQGTLFGKNTSAGAVLIDSTRPSTTEVGGAFEGSYGNRDAWSVKAALNVPLAEDVAALRISGMYSDQAGNLTDVNTGEYVNGKTSKAVKGQLLLDNDQGYSLQVIADWSKSDGNCCYGTADYINGPTQPLIDGLTLASGHAAPSKIIDDRETGLSQPTRQTVEDYGLTGIFSVELGAGELKSVTALRHFTLAQLDADADFSGADIFDLNETFDSQFFSQELTYSTKVSALDADLLLGGFFSSEDLQMTRQLGWQPFAQTFFDALLFNGFALPPGTAAAPVGTWSDETMGGVSKSYAAFAHLDAAVSDTINVIVGARYSIEKKTGSFAYRAFAPQPNAVFTVLGVAPAPAYSDSTTDKALSGTLGLQYRPNRKTMVYLTYNRGFKAGGVNIDANAAGVVAQNPAIVPGAVPLDPTFRPEKVNAFELGGKFQYLGGRARTNIALFYNDISDLQVAQFVGLQFTVLNAGKAKSYGAEIENLFEIVPGVQLGLDALYLPHAEYGVDPALPPALSGQRWRYAPKFSGNATLNLDIPLSDDVNFTGRAQYQYTGSQFINTASTATRGSVGLVNLSAGFKLDRLGLQIEGWVQNLTDETFPTLSFNTPLQSGDENAYVNQPRTYGVTLRGQF